MSSVFKFPPEIIALIIDIVGEDNDKDLLKVLALLSHSFLQICRKHIFATIELHDARPKSHVASSKKGFVKLLNSKPDVVQYICKLTYKSEDHSDYYPDLVTEDDELSPILPNLLRTISRLNCLKIDASYSTYALPWNLLNPSLTSAFLHLMHLPTINRIDLSSIGGFPWSSLASSINLHRLEIFQVTYYRQRRDGSPREIVQPEMLPKIREFHTSESDELTRMLLHAKLHDGRPAFNFMDLRRVSMPMTSSENEKDLRYLLQNAKLLEKLHLPIGNHRSLMGLHDILFPVLPTLRVLDLAVGFNYNSIPLRLGFLCEELEAMAGHNILEALSFDLNVDAGGNEAKGVGSIIQEVEKVVVKPGWSALRQVPFKFSIPCPKWTVGENITKLREALYFLPDKYPNLSKLEFIPISRCSFDFKCKFEFD